MIEVPLTAAMMATGRGDAQPTPAMRRFELADPWKSVSRRLTGRAARLLAEIGGCRARFPDPQALICLAGAAPSTRQSGKHKAVTFRWAVSKQLRDAVCDFAGGSRHASPWAAKIYADAVARGKDHPHAVRILARAWLYVIWDCWHHIYLRPGPAPRPPAPARRTGSVSK
jgi:transposase